jgi:hypothetical protein
MKIFKDTFKFTGIIEETLFCFIIKQYMRSFFTNKKKMNFAIIIRCIEYDSAE